MMVHGKHVVGHAHTAEKTLAAAMGVRLSLHSCSVVDFKTLANYTAFAVNSLEAMGPVVDSGRWESILSFLSLPPDCMVEGGGIATALVKVSSLTVDSTSIVNGGSMPISTLPLPTGTSFTVPPATSSLSISTTSTTSSIIAPGSSDVKVCEYYTLPFHTWYINSLTILAAGFWKTTVRSSELATAESISISCTHCIEFSESATTLNYQTLNPTIKHLTFTRGVSCDSRGKLNCCRASSTRQSDTESNFCSSTHKYGRPDPHRQSVLTVRRGRSNIGT